jgi:hypothetical protein
MFRKRPPGPDAETIERGDRYWFLIEETLDFSGAILEASGTIRWRYLTSPRRSPHSLVNLKRKPDFLVLNPDGLELLRIRRETPSSDFSHDRGEQGRREDSAAKHPQKYIHTRL